eukprot:gene10740-17815_t
MEPGAGAPAPSKAKRAEPFAVQARKKLHAMLELPATSEKDRDVKYFMKLYSKAMAISSSALRPGGSSLSSKEQLAALTVTPVIMKSVWMTNVAWIDRCYENNIAAPQIFDFIVCIQGRLCNRKYIDGPLSSRFTPEMREAAVEIAHGFLKTGSAFVVLRELLCSVYYGWLHSKVPAVILVFLRLSNITLTDEQMERMDASWARHFGQKATWGTSK